MTFDAFADERLNTACAHDAILFWNAHRIATDRRQFQVDKMLI